RVGWFDTTDYVKVASADSHRPTLTRSLARFFRPFDVTTTTADFLATVPLFGGLDQIELQRFADLTREKFYPRGSVILFENDPGDSLFIVRAGRVKVVLIGEDGREVILGVLGVGDHFGELSLIDHRPRYAHF